MDFKPAEVQFSFQRGRRPDTKSLYPHCKESHYRIFYQSSAGHAYAVAQSQVSCHA